MRKEIVIGVITTLFGLFVGYFLKDFQERPQPSVIIESITFEKIEKTVLPDIKIGDDLMMLSEKSLWTDELEATISISKLEKLIKDDSSGLDLPETVLELENISLFLPKLIDFVKKNKGKQLSTHEYRAFMKNELSSATWAVMTMNVAGMIRRGEFIPAQLAEEYPDAVASTNASILSRGKSTGWKLGAVSGNADKKDKSSFLALALLTEWYPDDLETALEILQNQVTPQLVINQKILHQLRQKYDEAKSFCYQDFVNISALVVNSGDKTVSIDKYAALNLPKLDRKFFMVSDAQKSRIAIPPGEVKTIQLRSDTPLEAQESEKLKSLYDTKIINCQLTMRIVTQQEFTPGWLHSEISEFSGDKMRLRNIFLEAVQKMPNKAN